MRISSADHTVNQYNPKLSPKIISENLHHFVTLPEESLIKWKSRLLVSYREHKDVLNDKNVSYLECRHVQDPRLKINW